MGLLLVGLGAWLALSGRGFGITAASGAMEHVRLSGDIRSLFLFGVAYAVTSLACTLPIFLVVAGSAPSAAGGPVAAAGQFISYALGMGSVLSTVVLGAAFFQGAVARSVRRVVPHVHRLSASFLLGAGLFLVNYWWDGWPLPPVTANGPDGMLHGPGIGRISRSGAASWRPDGRTPILRMDQLQERSRLRLVFGCLVVLLLAAGCTARAEDPGYTVLLETQPSPMQSGRLKHGDGARQGPGRPTGYGRQGDGQGRAQGHGAWGRDVLDRRGRARRVQRRLDPANGGQIRLHRQRRERAGQGREEP
ncbi:MAG: hypothetical protein KatS3mg060_2306 [Dehalococcoidia bacterium]|nr:MAG: hypothetical protein KatS3mg060_2306 [Dehalococcoidia bacterium]